MIIDEIIKEFRNKNKIFQQINIKWGSDDRTKQTFHINDGYEELFDVEFIDNNKFKEEILKHKENFYIEECYQVYPYDTKEELKNFYPIEKKNIEKFCNKFDSIAKYWGISIDIDEIEYNSGWQFLEFASYGLTNYAIEQLEKESKKMKTMNLKSKVIDEIMKLLNEVKDVQKLMSEFRIYVTTDCWTATSCHSDNIPNYNENILTWERKDFEELNFENGDSLLIGGNIVTGTEHKYKNEWIIAPKKLAEVQGEIFEKYLKSIIKSSSFKYLDLEFSDPYGLIDNCGWEHYMCIDATIENYTNNIDSYNRTQALVKEIMQEEDGIITLSGSPVYEEPKNLFNDEKLQPKGNFAYMIEFFSFDLINSDDDKYQGCFSKEDLNGRYIKDAMRLINDVETRAEDLQIDYEKKGVEVTVNGFNEGCQYGLAVYVWIPYQ